MQWFACFIEEVDLDALAGKRRNCRVKYRLEDLECLNFEIALQRYNKKSVISYQLSVISYQLLVIKVIRVDFHLCSVARSRMPKIGCRLTLTALITNN